MKPKLNTNTDLIALFFHTPDAVHAYKLADWYRAKRKTGVLFLLWVVIDLSLSSIGQSAHALPVNVANISTNTLPARRGANVPAPLKRIVDDSFDVGITVPKGWEHSIERDKDCAVIHCEEPIGLASVSLIAVDWGGEVKMKDFIPAMEKEVSKEYPMGKRIEDPVPGVLPKAFIWHQYADTYEGFSITSLVGYCAHEKYGFVFIGICGVGDTEMEKTVCETFSSFEAPSAE